MNIGSILTEAAKTAPANTALVHGGLRRTYRAFNERANRLAAALAAHGVKPGDRVAILQRNGPELLESLFAIFKAGAVAVPVNARLHQREYAYILEDSAAAAVIFTPEFADGLAEERTSCPALSLFIAVGAAPPFAAPYEEIMAGGDPDHPDAERAGDDLAWIFYTSGTTGKPKGAMLTHRNLRFMSDGFLKEIYPCAPGDVAIHGAPLTHGSGLWALPITAGAATQVITASASFSPDEVRALIERERATMIAFFTPTMITMMLNAPDAVAYDTTSLRFIGYGGSPMYVEDLRRSLDKWGPVLCQIYGQGECPMTISLLDREDHRVAAQTPSLQGRLASAGRRREGVLVAILDDEDKPCRTGEIGEICVRGDIVMKGYWNKPEATTEAFRSGWYHTGDLGKLDEDGFLYLLDRKKDLIISGGSNIYPREIEEVLLLHPGVLEVAVIGAPDRLWGESVMAVVRPRPGARPGEQELLDLCGQHLAGYKKPRIIHFVDDLPKSGYGKILKRELRDALLAEGGGSPK